MGKILTKKLIIILIIFFAILVGSFYYWQNFKNQDESEELTENKVFILLDDENNIILEEAVDIYPEARLQYEQKLKEIESNLDKGGDDDFLIANYSNFALYNNYLGNYKIAYDAYIKSLTINSKLRITWLSFGDLLVDMKAYKSADAAYNKAIELNRYDALNYIKLVNIFKILDDREKVEEIYKNGLEMTEKNISGGETLLLDDYAEWLVKIKSYDEAILIYEKLKEKQPQNKEAIDKKINNIKKKQEVI